MLNEALRENNSTEKETVIRIRKFAYNHKSVFLKEFNRDLKLSLILFLNKTYPLTEFFTKVSISCFKEERGIERTDKREFSSPKKEERKKGRIDFAWRRCSCYSCDPTRGNDECLTRRTAVDRNDPESRIREGLTL